MLAAVVNARGRPDVAVRYSLVIMAMRLAGSLGAAPHGVLAVAWAHLVVTVCSTFVILALARRHLPGAAGLTARSLGAPALATAAMALAVVATGIVLDGAPPAALLPAKMAAGALCYGAALYPLVRKRFGGAGARAT